MFSLIRARINGWVNNGEAGDLRRHRAHYDVTVMSISFSVASLEVFCIHTAWGVLQFGFGTPFKIEQSNRTHDWLLHSSSQAHAQYIPSHRHTVFLCHDDVIKWKHFPRYWPFYVGNSPVTGKFPSQRPVTRSFDVFSYLHLNKRWVNNCGAADLKSHRTHYDVIVMLWSILLHYISL